MKLFASQKALKSYLIPAVKIIICVAIILLSIYRNKLYIFLDIKLEGFFEIFEKIVFLIIGIVSIWTIYMSMIKIYYIHEDRKKMIEKDNAKFLKGKTYSLNEIVLLLEKNDIIEIKIKAGEKIFEIGSSSDCKAGSNNFFDKRFYMENVEYKNLDTVIDELKGYAENGYITVISIDEVTV